MGWSIVKVPVVLWCVLSLVAGCTVNPTPVGWTLDENGKAVFEKDLSIAIVRQVRCEMRDALVESAVGLVEEEQRLSETGKSRATQTAAFLDEFPEYVKYLKVWDIDPLVYVQALLFLNSTVGLGFELMTEESNTTSVDPDFSAGVGSNSLSLGIGNQQLKTDRSNLTKLTEIEAQFANYQFLNCHHDLAKEELDRALELQARGPVKNDHWKAQFANRTDLHYPIRGKIQLNKTVNEFVDFVLLDATRRQRYLWSAQAVKTVMKDTFGKKNATPDKLARLRSAAIRCSQSTTQECNDTKACYNDLIKLAGKSYLARFFKGTKKSGAAEKLTQTLTFTTTVSGGASPTLTFSPGGGSFKLEKTAFGLSNSRTDTHELIVTLASATPAKAKKATSDVKLGNGSLAKLVITRTNDADRKPDSICKGGTKVAKKEGGEEFLPAKLRTPAAVTEAPVGALAARESDEEKRQRVENAEREINQTRVENIERNNNP